MIDLRNIPLHTPGLKQPATLDTVVDVKKLVTPTEVEHYQVQRVIDIYVSPAGETLGQNRVPDREADRGPEATRGSPHRHARDGAGDARLVQELRDRPLVVGRSFVFDPGCPVQLL